MRDFMEFDTCPYEEEEEGAHLGQDGYSGKARTEAKALIHQLRRICGPEPEHARLGMKWMPHDFGEYLQVVCYFDVPARREQVPCRMG